MIDLIFEHTRSNGWNEEYENGFLRDIYGKNSWQEMTHARLYHCLQLVRCYPAFYFPEDYQRECQVFAIGEQVMWMNQFYEVVGFLDDWTRVILVGIEEGNQGVRCYAHPCELKKLVKDEDE